MKKYVNGKLCEMTEKDIARREANKANRNRRNYASNENRIKELEKTVADLLNKLEKIDNSEITESEQ